MSFWYDKKGKSYASKGNSSWVKAYAEHLVASLKDAFSARLDRHIAGTEGQHKAEKIIYDDASSVKDAIQSNTNLAFSIRSELQKADADLKTQMEEETAAVDARLQAETSALETRIQEETAALETRLQEETSARENGLSQKVDKEEGKGHSTCDFTQAEKRKLSEFSSIGSFEKQISAEDWVDGVLKIPYEEHLNSNPIVSVFCNRYDYEVYVGDKICSSLAGCEGPLTVAPINPKTSEDGSFSNWFTAYPKVSSRYYCPQCHMDYDYDEPHPYSVTQTEIICPVMVDDENNITLHSEIRFDGKVVIK